MKYQFKPGRGYNDINAQEVGDELNRIHEQHGSLVPSLVVAEARPKTAPLHPCFEWNDRIAAEEHRMHQARLLINCVHVVPEEGKRRPVQAFINVRVHEDSADDPNLNHGRAYVPVREVVSDPELREQHLNNIKTRLRNLRAEHSGFRELAEVWAAVDAACG
jgi:hypothetical protein